ncbi:MAG: hydroxyacid dehydrogenase [Bacteriovoracaceae bacterium]
MPHKILVADGFHKELFKELTTVDGFDVHPEAKVSQDDLPTLLKDVEALVIRSATTVNKNLLEAATNLKLVIRAGEGTDNIDKALCESKSIAVENTPGANNNSAAEHAVALMMSVLRHTPNASSTMTNGGWDKSKFVGNELWKKKVGIVGFGRIGQIVAKRISGFEPETFFFDPFVSVSPSPDYTKVNDLEEIFKTCDIVTIHTPLLPQTKNLITKDLLEKMPKHAVLINAARGGIVNEADLISVLKEGKIKAAGVDVFEQEPTTEDNELRKLSNVVCTPHLGASTEEAQLRVGEMVIHQLKEFFNNNNVVNAVKA